MKLYRERMRQPQRYVRLARVVGGLAFVAALSLIGETRSAQAQTYHYRSIGTASDYSVNSITATNGSQVITGAGTAWITANRGRGDRITIPFPAGTDYTIQSVDSETQIALTAPFTGTTGPGKTYNIARKFTTLTDWERCIDGTAACPGVSSSSLVADDRYEIGVAYKDSAFNERVDFQGSTTDTSHQILLTATENNWHNGIAGTGVILDGTGFTALLLRLRDEFITVEWLEVTGGSGSAIGIGMSGLGSPNKLTVRNCILHGLPSDAIAIAASNLDFDLYNNFIYDNQGFGILFGSAPNAGRVFNNTIFSNNSSGMSGTVGAGVVLRNNIAHSNGGNDYSVVGFGGGSSHNIASDTSGTSHSPSGGGQNSVPLASLNFVDDVLPGLDLHITTGSAAEDCGGVPAQPCEASTVFNFDIDGGARVTPWDIGADDIDDPTAVELVAFDAVGADRAVDLEWETASEIENLGFHLYRSTSSEEGYERITTSLIQGAGSTPEGASYHYHDTDLTNDVTYFYRLEDIETSGRTEWHGPVAATPSVETDDDAPSSRATYGDPGRNALRVTAPKPRKLVIELVTEGFFVETADDGSERLVVPGLDAFDDAASLAVPVKRAWVDALAGRKVALSSVRESDVVTFTGLEPADLEAAELVADRRGTVRAARRRNRRAFRAAGLHPSSSGRVVDVAFHGDLKKALVELAPLRWDASGETLLLARRLVVTLSFRGREPGELSAGGSRGRRYRAPPSHAPRSVVARLHTTERGLHRVRYEHVFRGRRGVSAARLRLSRQGAAVAYHIEPRGSRFGPSSALYFLSEGGDANPFGNEAVYELETGASGEVMATASATAWGPASNAYRASKIWEEERIYQAALVDAPDRWLWDALFAPTNESYPLDVSALAPGAASLSIRLQGASDFAAAPDHHVRAYVNGNFVGEHSWDGKRAVVVDVTLAAGTLRDGDNELEIENVGDTAAEHSMVMLDSYTLTYPRLARGEDGAIEGAWLHSGTAELAGFSDGAFVLDTTEPSPMWLTGVAAASDTLRFRAEAGRSYVAAGGDAVHRPVVTRAAAARWKTRRRADYVVIGPAAFIDVARPLLELRRRQGLSVAAAAIEDIYAEFGFGESTPEAIKDFLAFAFHCWASPPRYVVLLGDGTYDFEDRLETGVRNQVPPRIVKTSFLWTASDPSYAAVNGDDAFPDLAIGRLPAATVDELRIMVDKILAYERGDAGVHRSAVVLVADNPDDGGNFERNARALATGVLAAEAPRTVSLRRLGPAATRSAIREGFDEGASLVSYMGHGGIHLWGDESFFNRGDVASLEAEPQQPLVLTMNCLNGYFHFPYFASLAEELVRAENKGAVAAFSPTGLSLDGPAHVYHEKLLDELFHGGHLRLGDAILAAQRAYASTGAFPELLSIYHLFGDPALALK